MSMTAPAPHGHSDNLHHINPEVTDYLFVCLCARAKHRKKCRVPIRTYGTLNMYCTLPYRTLLYRTVPSRTVPGGPEGRGPYLGSALPPSTMPQQQVGINNR